MYYICSFYFCGYSDLSVSILQELQKLMKAYVRNVLHGKNLGGEKLASLVNRELFAKFSSPIFTDTPWPMH